MSSGHSPVLVCQTETRPHPIPYNTVNHASVSDSELYMMNDLVRMANMMKNKRVYIPANTKHLYNICTCWTNVEDVEPTLYKSDPIWQIESYVANWNVRDINISWMYTILPLKRYVTQLFNEFSFKNMVRQTKKKCEVWNCTILRKWPLKLKKAIFTFFKIKHDWLEII